MGFENLRQELLDFGKDLPFDVIIGNDIKIQPAGIYVLEVGWERKHKDDKYRNFFRVDVSLGAKRIVVMLFDDYSNKIAGIL